MSLATDPLPTNPSALRIFAADLQAELARKDIEIAANAAEICIPPPKAALPHEPGAFDLNDACKSAAKIRGSQSDGDYNRS
jgi:hypothetical protein